ncbi:hypothetical protein GOP47_0022094 [Adiantum capillus-veneris]|uniref:G-patch domain-containing protein n=1 Tax=Adiantum capillus-veneris TaxID=13818 RepID=A0A9D4Z7I7_ADICA|nr:hypothetical protein GOP47_0022094 [Adiantum capillus-veneris]
MWQQNCYDVLEGLHRRDMAAPEAPLLYEGVSRSSAAFRLLKEMGWQEGEGLGKEKQGITKHVRVTKKNDNLGVGVDAKQKAASNWTFNTTAFDSILKNLNVIIADTNQEADAPKKIPTQDAKHERGALTKKVTRPQGRYKKRELGKLLRGKSQADLDAILGYGKLTSKEVWPTLDGSKTIVEKSSLSDVGCVPAERLAARANDATSTIRDAQSLEELCTVNIPSDWWGTKFGFVPAGALERERRESESCNGEHRGSETTQSTKARQSFCEQDQEDLYKLVQNKATKGRQGLGIADRPRKIGGAHWEGQKVMLDTVDDEGETKGVLDVYEKGARIAGMVCEMDEGNQDLARNEEERSTKRRKHENKPSWNFFCRQLLREAPAQTMKIKDLHRQICLLHSSRGTEDCAQPSILLKEKFKEKLAKSSKFVIEGKKVSLMTSM